ncbi:ribonucleoside-diphosphate reductase subunit M1 [Fonticula alba]|uniref:Ribonucleoside-diphosphate reductase n=1 Tax=Fonticula alba TaxID=691883 RepID=A0A058Z7B8_FONAL|nr:ribonucleoside-diphosphate reductase subunit M1 [Fonticula alba]KCV69971.1 ribonucleoside-diphosphate reductase subunit M1 [Fonticula alba]|eukprot:XP_009495577.1 ribonucleoside-diphosphate reductase subunit M1 [Fonticula alba]
MLVTKRNGTRVPVDQAKIIARIQNISQGLDLNFVDPEEIAIRVQSGMYEGVATADIDSLIAETAAYKTTQHPDFALLAARVSVSSLHKQTPATFSEAVDKLFNYTDAQTGRSMALVSEAFHQTVMANAEVLNAAIRNERDFEYQFFGFKTLERSYLLRVNGKVVERPQYMIMRVAVGIHGSDIPAALETYEYMSQRYFTHASPTLFNCGSPRPQLSSCFLLTMKDDSIDGIYDTLRQCALISKTAGGIGLNVHNIRATGSYIAGTNGYSNGLVPMLRVFNATARYVDQGGNKRPGAFAIYLEPWHADVESFIELRKNTGAEETRARDLFFALWVPDLFMKRVESGGDWSLFCPREAPGLHECYGEEFETLYQRYESEGRARKVMKAQLLWRKIMEAQVETGTPFIMYKDACNQKSNQKNLGTIKCSNLCTEIVQYTSNDEVAVCNLASIALPQFIHTCPETGAMSYDFEKLRTVTGVVARNLDRIIDINYYPVEEARNSNLRHRPIGIGVQGLADLFIMMRMPFESPEARALNKAIFETIYFAAVEASCQTAERVGPYASYEGSPASAGQLQFDLWGVTPSDRWDWAGLKERIARHGLRNSLLVAPMPTASTSQILGFNECIEPYTSNIYVRRVLSGEFQMVNPHLIKDLIRIGVWNDNVRQMIIAAGGSVQRVPSIPDDLKALYKTTWEISQRSIIDMAADRGAFIDQSQSLNIFIGEPTASRLTSMHFYGWKKGLKTGMYYLRTKPAAEAIKFTVDQQLLKTPGGSVTNTPRMRGGTATITAAAPAADPASLSPESRKAAAGGFPTPAIGLAATLARMSLTEDSSATSSATTITPPAVSPLATAADADAVESDMQAAADAAAAGQEEAYPTLTREQEMQLLCSLENPESCTMCSG